VGDPTVSGRVKRRKGRRQQKVQAHGRQVSGTRGSEAWDTPTGTAAAKETKRRGKDAGKSEHFNGTEEAGEPTRGTPWREEECRGTESLEGKTMETSSSSTVSTKLQRIAELAREAPERVFSSLAYHIDVDFLREAFRRTRKDGATGVMDRLARSTRSVWKRISSLYSIASSREATKHPRCDAPTSRRVTGISSAR
jgi:hypothetical protein